MPDGFSSVVCNPDMTSCPLIRARPNSTFARQTDLETEHEQLAMNPWGTQAGFSATIRKVAIESVAFPRYACPHRSQFHAKNVGPHGHCKRDRLCPTTRQSGRHFGMDGPFWG